jgi:hypothetical protein
MYWGMKEERRKRQELQSELEKERASKKELESRVAAIEGALPKETDAEGNPVDPRNKPLTIAEWEALEKQRMEMAQKQQQEMQQQAVVVTQAQVAQEEYVRSVMPDYEEVGNLAKEVLSALHDTQKLSALLPEKHKQHKLEDLSKKLVWAAANANKLDIDGYNGAMIAYEIGQLHPNYGKHGANAAKDGQPNQPDKAKQNGGYSPEQLKKIEANAQRRSSSAAVSGNGGVRTVAPEDVTIDQLLSMSRDKMNEFRQKYPSHYARLMRG